MGMENVIAYPGDPQLVSKLQSNNSVIWPEIDFVENYLAIATGKLDTNVKNEPNVSDIQYLFESDIDYSKINDIGGLDVVTDVVPYTDKSNVSFVYELYERAKYLTLFDSFDDKFLKLLSKEEFNNINKMIDGDDDLIDFVKKLTNQSSLINGTETTTTPNGTTTPQKQIIFNGYLASLSPYERFNYFRDHIPTTNYISDVIDETFKFEVKKSLDFNRTLGSESEMNDILKNYEPEKYRPFIYPFNSDTYLGYLKKNTGIVKTKFTVDPKDLKQAVKRLLGE